MEVVATVSFRLDWMWAGGRQEARVTPRLVAPAAGPRRRLWVGLVGGWEAQEWLSAGGPGAEALGQRGRAGVGGWGQAGKGSCSRLSRRIPRPEEGPEVRGQVSVAWTGGAAAGRYGQPGGIQVTLSVRC